MRKSILVLAALATMVLFGCKERAYIDGPGENSHNVSYDSIPVEPDPEPSLDPEGVVIPEGTIDVNEAVRLTKKLYTGQVSAQKYFIKGWVKGFNRGDSFDSDFPKYGNDFVYLSARQDGQGPKQFYAYRLLGKFGAKLPDLECVKEGDFVIISCYLTNYNGVYESSGACFVYVSNNAHFNEVFPEFPGCPAPGEGEISVTEAEKVALGMASKETTEESYRIRGVVTGITDTSLSSYGNLTFNISDGLSYATCYRIMGKDNKKFTDLNQVAVGDTVLVNAKIQNYNGTCEPVQGYVEESTNPVFNGAFPPVVTINATCAEAKTAAMALGSGGTSKEQYIVEGYVQSAGYDATISKGQQKWFWMDDKPSGGKVLEAYWCNVPDGATPVPVGAKIRLTGYLMNYNGTIAEIKNGDIEILEEPQQ